ncbi:MAG: nucleotidyltransferase family protein [Phycisphaerales bacterium]|nr:nucleotidyltransferase family protein [Phycisphaerales bacterium]
MTRRISPQPELRSPRYRIWNGRELHPAEEAFMFFDGKGPVPETLARLHERLESAGIPHILMGAMAAKAYGMRRTTEDVDICVRPEDLARFRSLFVAHDYQAVEGRSRRFFDAVRQVTIDILVAGEIAGNAKKQTQVRFPDPSEGRLVDGLLVPSLARLIELKLVTWRLKDWADVIELIRINRLDESFCEQLHPVVRAVYVQCYDNMVEEDRYNPEIHDQPPEPR